MVRSAISRVNTVVQVATVILVLLSGVLPAVRLTATVAVYLVAATTLASLGVAYEAKVLSAHRTPQAVAEWTQAAEGRGIQVIIAAAGMAAHLAGAGAGNGAPEGKPRLFRTGAGLHRAVR